MTISTTTPLGRIGRLLIEDAADVKFKHVAAIAVWKIDGNDVAYWMLFFRDTGTYLGRVRDLYYLKQGYKR